MPWSMKLVVSFRFERLRKYGCFEKNYESIAALRKGRSNKFHGTFW